MHYAYRYRLHPTEDQREALDYHRDTCRQLYNHALTEFEQIPVSAGTLIQRVRQLRDQLPDLKNWWDDLTNLYSTVAQAAVMRIEDSIKAHSLNSHRTGTTPGVSTGRHPADFGVSPTSNLASSSTTRTARPSSHSRHSLTFHSVTTAKFPRTSPSKRVASRKNGLASGTLRLVSRAKTSPKTPIILLVVSGLTVGFSSMLTTRTGVLSAHLTCKTNESDSRANNARSRGNNRAHTTGRNNG